ncbi:MAG: hypothetical protein IKN64_12075 [Desulfovibrio sp.]|nr:hypothetical protein [Desulfovibrio sp.]
MAKLIDIHRNDPSKDADNASENLSRAVTEANALYVLTRKMTQGLARNNDFEKYRAIEDVLSTLEIKESEIADRSLSVSGLSGNRDSDICEMWEMLTFVGFQCTLLLLKTMHAEKN